MVLDGKFKHAGWQDGGVIRSCTDGSVLARLLPTGRWSRPVRESRERPKRPSDLVTPRGPAVTVVLDKGKFY